MSKVNFTPEHLEQLEKLSVTMLFEGTLINGLVGTKLNVHELVHNTSVNSLITLNSNLKKEIEKISDLDEWSMNDYQQKKLETSKRNQEFVNLLIGYKKFQAERESDKAKLAELQMKYREIKKSTMTPAEQLKELERQITSLGGATSEEEKTETTEQPQ